GDDDQSIYRFRGAEVGNIDAFKRSWPDVRVIKLEQNYRSTPSILDLANSVIRHNHQKGDLKKLWTENKDIQKPQLYYVEDEVAEAELVAQKIKGVGDYDNTAVLFRTNAQSGSFENVFTLPEFRIPYKVVGALKFYDREQVKDGLAMMYLLSNARDVVSFRRMVNKPARGIGPGAMMKIDAAIDAAGGNCVEGLSHAPLSGKAKEGADAFLQVLKDSSDLLRENKLVDALDHLFRASNLYSYYADMDRKEGRTSQEGSRVADFDTLVTQASQYGSDWSAMTEFLQTLALDPTTVGYLDPSAKGGVTLITMHNTKGLEYDRVFMVGMEDEIFPGRRDDNTQEDIEEERRICYVAMTRARYELYMFSASSRLRWGSVQRESPSMFLNEIDPSHMEEIDNRFKAKLGAKFRFDERYNDDYKSGYGNGFGNTYTSKFGGYGSSSGSKGKYSSNYVNTDNAYKSSYDDDFGPGTRHQGPKPSAASKYNIRNNANAAYRSGTAQDSKPSAILVKKADGQDAPVPGTITYEVGDRIRSEFYGEGQITGKRNFAGREVLDVKFDSGRTGTFASDKVAFEKI
ncbi:MAG TPA: DNA helicase UvrD, partial [Sphaerochaeta sp.]|nr:DNA helicase UvrD [Sphaerochaeta sp.]